MVHLVFWQQLVKDVEDDEDVFCNIDREEVRWHQSIVEAKLISITKCALLLPNPCVMGAHLSRLEYSSPVWSPTNLELEYVNQFVAEYLLVHLAADTQCNLLLDSLVLLLHDSE